MEQDSRQDIYETIPNGNYNIMALTLSDLANVRHYQK
jgi:hypothetical protein